MLDYVWDVLLASGICEDKISADISTYFIADTIQRLYPDAVAAIYSEEFEKQFQMPQIDHLEVKKVESHILVLSLSMKELSMVIIRSMSPFSLSN